MRRRAHPEETVTVSREVPNGRKGRNGWSVERHNVEEAAAGSMDSIFFYDRPGRELVVKF